MKHKRPQRIVVSWMAYTFDFLKTNDGRFIVDEHGTTSNLHKHFFDYDKHILLSSSTKKEDEKFKYLLRHLIRSFPDHEIDAKYLDIKDPINFDELLPKSTELLLSLKDLEIEIFISPGTPAMQVAWFLSHYSLGINTRLFQVRPGKFTDSGEPEKIYVELEKSIYTSSWIVREKVLDRRDDKPNIFIPPSLEPVYELAKQVSNTDKVTTLITGDTGTGKEELAKYIHENSSRNKNKMVVINCAAFNNDELLESRLFGHLKGVFTGAHKTKNGAFQHANNSTIFLDEIGDISPKMQQTLLRVLQEKEISKLGSIKAEKINVRVIAATHKNLEALSRKGEFRWDLYFRLAVAELHIPGIKDWKPSERNDIFNFLMEKWRHELKRPKLQFTKLAWELIDTYSFPGNIREMENLIERLFTFVEPGMKVTEFHLPSRFKKPIQMENSLKLTDVENTHIKRVLNMFPDNKQKVCRVLGISRNTLENRIKNHLS